MADDSELPDDVLAAVHANRKIDAIKLLRERRGLELKEAKHIVDAYMSGHPSLAVKKPPPAESGVGRLVFAGVLAALAYAAYRYFS